MENNTDYKKLRNVADQCRALGLKVGDTIEGTEGSGGSDGWFNTTRLTLLWLGEKEAAWLKTYISNSNSEWSKPVEAVNWTLRGRDWRKVA